MTTSSVPLVSVRVCSLGLLAVLLAFIVGSCSTSAKMPKSNTDGTELYTTLPEAIPYRIPAIAQTSKGAIVVVSDYRYCGSDIGFGRVDLHARLSADGGNTWGYESIIASGSGIKDRDDCGFGDAAIVADATSNTLLLLCVRGNTVYTAPTTTRQNPNRVARMYSYDGGLTWTSPENITESIYSLFDHCPKGPVQSLFVASGKIFQSNHLKVGSHYRLYAALCARPNGNRVIYSDDFGKTWNVLGSVDEYPAPQGDEPKCVELPDGNVLLSSRAGNGRLFNIFKYDTEDASRTTGRWEKVAFSSAANAGIRADNNSCNGGILTVPVKRCSDGRKMHLLLQSVPFGKGRTHVGIYYKPLVSEADYATPEAVASQWEGRYPCTTLGSAYSELILQKDGLIGFVYEESTHQADYSIIYKSFTLEEITGGRYRLRK